MSDVDRGAGRTTEQLRNAPRGAVFVWCNHRTSYATALAVHLRRADIRVVGPDFITSGRWYGTTHPIIIDHAYRAATLRESEKLRELLQWQANLGDRLVNQAVSDIVGTSVTTCIPDDIKG